MNIVAWLLSLSILFVVFVEAVNFHEATVCRQKAWLKSTELATRMLLYKPKERDWATDIGCKVHATRNQRKISWRRLPKLKSHKFELKLSGKL